MENLFGGMMNQAKKMQEKLQQEQEALANAEYTGEAGAGLVSVVLTGRYDVKKVNIDDSLLKDEKVLLEDLIAAAVNDGVRKVEAAQKEKLSGFASGIDLPEGFKMPF